MSAPGGTVITQTAHTPADQLIEALDALAYETGNIGNLRTLNIAHGLLRHHDGHSGAVWLRYAEAWTNVYDLEHGADPYPYADVPDGVMPHDAREYALDVWRAFLADARKAAVGGAK